MSTVSTVRSLHYLLMNRFKTYIVTFGYMSLSFTPIIHPSYTFYSLPTSTTVCFPTPFNMSNLLSSTLFDNRILKHSGTHFPLRFCFRNINISPYFDLFSRCAPVFVSFCDVVLISLFFLYLHIYIF